LKPVRDAPAEVIEQHIHEHARHRDVEPDRQRPPRERHVTVELSRERAIDGRENERDHHRSQYDVRDEEREVHAADPALPAEGSRAGDRVIDDVGDEEQRGGDTRRQHARAVHGDAAAADGQPAGDQERRARRVERGIERGQRGNLRAPRQAGFPSQQQHADETHDDERQPADDRECRPVSCHPRMIAPPLYSAFGHPIAAS
jgi:hypothetical protein